MYSLLLFFALCSLWLFVKFLNSRTTSKKQLLALFAINLLLVYTHYAGWLLVTLEIVPLLWCRRDKLRPFLAAMAGLIPAYAPWVYGIMVAAEPGKGLRQNIGWVTRPHLGEPTEYFVLLNRPFLFSQSNVDALNNRLTVVIVLLLFVVPLLAFGWQVFKQNITDEGGRVRIARWLFFFSFAPALLAFSLSWLLPYSIWGTRHLIIAAGPYSILAALALRGIRRDWIRTTAFLLLASWFLLSGALFTLRHPPVFIWCAWEPLAKQITQFEPDASQEIRIYTHEDLIAYHLWFALDADRKQRFKVLLAMDVPGVPNDPAYFLPRNFSDISTQNSSAPLGDVGWLAFRAKQWDEASPPLKLWLEKGYQANRVLSIKAQGQQAFLVKLKRN